jgi:hypothetical protein
MWSGRRLPTCRRNTLSPSSEQKSQRSVEEIVFLNLTICISPCPYFTFSPVYAARRFRTPGPVISIRLVSLHSEPLLPKTFAQAVTLLAYSQEVPCSRSGTQLFSAFRRLSPSCRVNADIVYWIRTRWLPSTSFPFHYSLFNQSLGATDFFFNGSSSPFRALASYSVP